MALYLIGDVQGCNEALGRLLEHIDFSPSRDALVLLGDLVNRGPDSAGVLRRLMHLGDAARCVLGNHDLHLLALAAGVRGLGRSDTVQDVLHASDSAAMLEWLRHRNMALLQPSANGPCLMVHAGVLPSWSVEQTMSLAAEVEVALRGPHHQDFLVNMYGNSPASWGDELQGWARLRVIVNALTRLRFCSASGLMEFDTKESVAGAPAGFMPWFDVPGRQSAQTPIAFGHWSTLGPLQRPDLHALDTGCVWGGCLSALRFDTSAKGQHELLQVPCPQAQAPG